MEEEERGGRRMKEEEVTREYKTPWMTWTRTHHDCVIETQDVLRIWLLHQLPFPHLLRRPLLEPATLIDIISIQCRHLTQVTNV